jgi:hypothetical protein
MTDLRDRIAEALKTADRRVAGFISYEERADAVIAELNLDKQFGCPVAGHHHCRCSHRYTTPWKDNDD